ncbi:RluA family pseudouridine synthase [Shewanella sp. WXL01]|uniref:Pseudouridine synthase n=1 Tax=Shewanella maritima TaxID=2520507 RepID=A0A411PKE9_9GAMM|nr:MULTISPECIES: RluA family pseudouridine synthase [Shewanella]NKF51038.1 RluA family pseudouridine synthase [Shewanella sp. WXL01]QBF83995.1 RluA family pseudouridine synthase [Shewanella maritima]
MQVFDYRPPAIPWLDIRYVDRDIIVINKPSGLLSNPGIAAHTHDCALTRLQRVYPDAILVHRLDCDTSGIMVFARNKKAESSIKTQFQDRLITKEYIAEVNGHLTNESGVIDKSLAADKENRPLQKVSADGKVAITNYQVLEQREHSTLVQLLPQTGRTHQLRVHMLALGNVILGDQFYANEHVANAKSRLQLHAQRLTFTHPYKKSEVSFYSKHSF